MTLAVSMQRSFLRALAVALLPALPAHALQPAAEPIAQGLIVQLRDAPTHTAMAREQALAVSEGTRLQQVLDGVPEVRALPHRPNGTSARVLRFDKAMTRDQAQALAARLAASPEVAWAVPDVRERRLQAASNPPNDPFFGGFSGQWWLQPVVGSNSVPIDQRLRGVAGFQTAWAQVGTGSAAARVAVLDNGVLTTHPELVGKLLPGYDMVSDKAYSNDSDGRDADPSDPGDWVDANDKANDPANYASCAIEASSWHGTAIAGMLAAKTNNGVGTAAINWQASVLPVRVAAKCGAAVSDIVDGMRWAAGLTVQGVPTNPNPVRVVSVSFGGDGACDPYQAAIDELRSIGVVIVAAAGNDHTTPSRPAKCSGVIGVTALNRDGFKSNYANFGPELTASGIATVGGDDIDSDARWNSLADSGLLSLGNTGSTKPATNDYFYYWGTSFSAPQVAGAISLMLSVNPNLSYDQIVAGLKASARPHVTSPVSGVNACSQSNPGRCLCTAQTCGAGILDVVQALAYAANPTGYVAPVRQAASIDTAELRAAAAQGADRPANTVVTPPSSGGGGGGGGMGAPWLAALALAAAALRRRR
jgi:serine protease